MADTINKIAGGAIRFAQNAHDHRAFTLDDYQRIAVSSAVYPGQGTPFGLMYAALGLGEAGEVQNKVKKLFRDDNILQFTDEPFEGEHLVKFGEVSDERKAALVKELGGNLWYIAACAKELGLTLGDIALANLEELYDRGQRGTLQGDGDDR